MQMEQLVEFVAWRVAMLGAMVAEGFSRNAFIVVAGFLGIWRCLCIGSAITLCVSFYLISSCVFYFVIVKLSLFD